MASLSQQEQDFFQKIETGDADSVRRLLESDKNLARVKLKSANWAYDPEYELDAYKFLGAYIGALTGLQLAILKGNEKIALDIIDSSLGEGDLDEQFGGGNSALHLATFVGMKDVVRRLLERGADRNMKNNKGLRPIDVLDDPEMKQIFEKDGSNSQ